MTLRDIKRVFKPKVPQAAQGLNAKAEDNDFTAKEIAEAASLPIHLVRDQTHTIKNGRDAAFLYFSR